ncbi:polypeptide N-acetylgalactosaminyltransferase 4-like [Haliotis rufescens]|uniref:polypeptide N-acetylgalactosaminyltransferase 4-like n=1 Tax=Haliotis rufescens TaxID=6454 RepID=UPI00201F308F|nr:polypeptide N-acetylgalactosaminyltransferase 4-like [Haliotis rufescens]
MKKKKSDGNTALTWQLCVAGMFMAGILYVIVDKDEPEPARCAEVCRGLAVKTGSRKIRSDTYKKYDIAPDKALRLEHMLDQIMKSHIRPDDDHYGYNLTRSDEIPVSRDIKDARPKECLDRTFNYTSFPTISVISPFYNEALTPLVRHVHALLTRTPPQVLLEVLLVDDMSTFSYLGQDLQDYFSLLDPRIKLLRNKQREGLIRSRLFGADVARGEVLVFLDAHMEVNHGWVEPLLHRLGEEEELVLQSEIPPILSDTFDIDTGQTIDHRGGFGWDMSYLWFPLPQYLNQFKRSDFAPVPFPVLQGGSIVITKSYFEALGRFDSGLAIWGGEHFEMSFNVWMTGGRVELIPCSKVGHIFKDTKINFGSAERNYVVAKNNLRVAEVWMDDYKELTRAAIRAWQDPEPEFSKAEWESIEERRRLRWQRKSKSFSWFLKTVLPEQPVPSEDDVQYGEVASSLTKHCLYVADTGRLGLTSTCMSFVVVVKENTFSVDRWGRFKHKDKCVGFDQNSFLLTLTHCPYVEGDLAMPNWTTNSEGALIYNGQLGPLCATLVQAAPGVGSDMVQLQTCGSNMAEQKWSFMYHFKY